MQMELLLRRLGTVCCLLLVHSDIFKAMEGSRRNRQRSYNYDYTNYRLPYAHKRKAEAAATKKDTESDARRMSSLLLNVVMS